MAFQLTQVVPWGRNLNEYKQMFGLSDGDLSKRIADFGGGPSSFNCEATKQGASVTTFDPVYQFSKADLQARIEEVRLTVMRQMKENADRYVWTTIRSLEELENLRMSAMRLFLTDYEQGKAENRYICNELPARTPYDDRSFDIGLSSHFLLMYTQLGYDFHIQAITEMLRICKEVRIFPIVDIDANKSDLTQRVIEYFKAQYSVEIKETTYEFQKGGNKLLSIQNIISNKEKNHDQSSH